MAQPIASGFWQLWLCDQKGVPLAAFDGAFSPSSLAALPQGVPAAASAVASAGQLAPRTATAAGVGNALLLSILGDFHYLHALCGEFPDAQERRRLLAALLAFEAQQAAGGEARMGDLAWLHSVRAAMRAAYQAPPATLASPEPPQVFAHALVGVRGGRLTLELHLRNATDRPARGVSVALEAPMAFLRPVALFGQGAEVVGNEVRLTDALDPGTRVLTVHLDPQEPRAGLLSLALTYLDNDGHARLVKARPQRVSAVFPGLCARELRERGSLAAAVGQADRVRDAWRFAAPLAVHPAFAFARAKEAVERERPLRLLEFSSLDPHYYEAWYLAQVAPHGPPVLAEVSVWGDFSLVDLRVATERQEDLVGILAEYRRRVRELLSERFMGTAGPLASRPAAAARGGPAPPGLHGALVVGALAGALREPDVRRALSHAQEWDAHADFDLVSEFEKEMEAAHAAPQSPLPRGPSRAPRRDPSLEEHFQVSPGLLAAYERLVVPEVAARCAALAGRRLPRGG